MSTPVLRRTPSYTPNPVSEDEKKRSESSLHVADLDTESSVDEDGESDAVHPWRHKGPALIMVLLLSLGSNFASASLSPMKSTLKKELDITNAQYGVISSANFVINTILPILSGIAIDYYGAVPGSLVSSSFVMVGAVLAAIGTSVSSYGLLVAGEIIEGIGSVTIETAQSKLYTHWFRGTIKSGPGSLGLVYASDIAIGRVYSVVAKVVAVPIMDSTGSWTWTFWVPAILCAVTLAINIAYAIFQNCLPLASQPMTGRRLRAAAQEKLPLDQRTSGLSNILVTLRYVMFSVLAVPACFWIIVVTQLLQAGTVGLYTSNLADMVSTTRGASNLTAGYTSAIGQIIPIILTPLVGLAFDLWGFRMAWVTCTAALYILVFGLLGFTTINAYAPTILGSVALSSNAVPFIACIPLLVPRQASIGTAFGIWKAVNSAGTTILEVAGGAIQDLTPTGKNQYNNVFYLLIAMKSIDVCYGLGYDVLDKRYFSGILRASEKQRVAVLQREAESPSKTPVPLLLRPIKAITILGVAVTVAMFVTAWVVYIVYALGT